jgi:pilus assembly protein CpaC
VKHSIFILIALLLIAAAVGTAPGVVAAQQGPVRLEVTIGKSQVVDLKDPFTRVSVTNPGIADVFTISPNQLLLNGKTPGVTSLIVFYPDRTLFFDVVVQTDMALLVERLREIAPRDDIQVQAAQDAIIVRGTVSSEQMIPGAGAVAAAFAPKGKVINLLALAEVKPQQVLLQMHVAEVAREALRELGFSWRALGKTLQGAAFPGFPFFPALGLLGGVQTTSGAVQNIRTPEFDFATANAGSGFFLSSAGQRDYAGIAQALARRNALRTLAKPNLITQSGKEAKFISGGEFPFPVAQQNNTVTIEFKEFGVSILFTPVILDGEIINLRVRPEVSTLDFTQGLLIQGFRIPALRTRRMESTVDLRRDRSLIISGLFDDERQRVRTGVPLLMHIPILGQLFSSTSWERHETELVVIVTPEVVSALNPRPQDQIRFVPDTSLPAREAIEQRLPGRAPPPPQTPPKP